MLTLHPDELKIPEAVLQNLPPRPPGSQASAELFRRWTGLVFDAISPAAAAADGTLQFLLHGERAARMVQQHALNDDLPGFRDLLDQLWETLFERDTQDDYEREIQRAVQHVYVQRLTGLAQEAGMPQVRALANWELDRIADRLESTSLNDDTNAHRYMLRSDIRRFLNRPLAPTALPRQPAMPPGSPIGQPAMEWLTPTAGAVLISGSMPDLSCSHR
jgi:hypothetical protein